jgi:IS1 family transposase
MNRLKRNKQEMILNLLVEGNSIRAIERITGVHRDTIMRLTLSVGESCRYYMDQIFQNLNCRYVECDEIWTYVGKKQKNVKHTDNGELGNQYVFVALDRETKLVPLFTVGKRDFHTAYWFMRKLRRRIDGEFQLTTDKFNAYYNAVTWTFGTRVHYAMLQKLYRGNGDNRREGYSPSQLRGIDKSVIYGNPEPDKICTSYIERQNLTMRTHIKRLTRLTIAFSKKLDNLKASLAIHFWHYNFMRTHSTLRMTPAMSAGIMPTFGTWDLVL